MLEKLPVIDPEREYTLQEVVKEKLIEWVNGYNTLYSMVTEFDMEGNRKPATITNHCLIKTIVKGRPWAKKAWKIYIIGKEIIEFLKLHNLKYTEMTSDMTSGRTA